MGVLQNILETAKRMQRRSDSFLTDKGKRILIIISAFLLMYLISYIIDPFSIYWQQYSSLSWYVWADWCITLIFCITVSQLSIAISKRLNTKVLWTEKPLKRFLLESTFNFLAVVSVLFFLSIVYILLEGTNIDTVLTIEEKRDFLQWLLASFFIAFVIIGINTGDYLIANWKNSAVKAIELKQVAVEAELQALRLQLDPHFVFNSLSVLSELILKDQQLGHEYAENFAKIYRYLLVHSKKDFIPLEEEIKFLNAYIFLLQQRIGEGVNFEMQVDKSCLHWQLPPLTLQMLVENALKHNKTIKSDPLRIRVYCNEKKELIVENNFRPIGVVSPSSGIGLENIIRRYRLMSGEIPDIYQDEKIFKVTVPLISNYSL